MVKEDPVRLELSLTPSYGKNPVIVGLVESLDLVARRDREGRLPRDLQGNWDWTVRHGKVSTGGWNPMLKEALQTMFDTGLPAIVYEELTGDEYRPVVGLVESLDLVARRDREGRLPRDLQGSWDWTVRHGKVSTGGWNPMLKEALQTMFDTGLPAIVYEELTGDEYRPVDGVRHVK